MPRAYRSDYRHYGYVFLTTSPKDASFYGLLTLMVDNRSEVLRRLNEVLRMGMVIGVKTSNLRKGLEIDPEREQYDKHWESVIPEFLEFQDKFFGKDREWYRYYGNIPRSCIFPLYDVPLDKQDPDLLKCLASASKVVLV